MSISYAYSLKDIKNYIGKECYFFDIPSTPLKDCPRGILTCIDDLGFEMSYTIEGKTIRINFNYCLPLDLAKARECQK